MHLCLHLHLLHFGHYLLHLFLLELEGLDDLALLDWRFKDFLWLYVGSHHGGLHNMLSIRGLHQLLHAHLKILLREVQGIHDFFHGLLKLNHVVLLILENDVTIILSVSSLACLAAQGRVLFSLGCSSLLVGLSSEEENFDEPFEIDLTLWVTLHRVKVSLLQPRHDVIVTTLSTIFTEVAENQGGTNEDSNAGQRHPDLFAVA